MKPYLLSSVLLILQACALNPEREAVQSCKVRHVDPFICTADDHGQTDVAAAIPFGMVKPCPDTYPTGHSGYDYSAKEILGFSHTRFSGVGCRGTGGNIRVLPFVGGESLPSRLRYDKSSERAEPGFYGVSLEGGIDCMLTATGRVAFHKYRFPKSGNSGLSVDLASSFAGHVSEQHQIDGKGVLSGKVESVNICNKGKYSFYYAFFMDKEEVEISQEESKVIFSFATEEGEELSAYCALSVVSAERAVLSLQEAMKLPFEEVKEAASRKWNDLLSVVEVQSGDERLKKLFYTHLYHACQSPFLISEEDGTYRGSNGMLYQDTMTAYYHGWSIWDTFRSKLPLLSLLYPERYRDMMASLGELYKQGKPDWATETEPFITVRTEYGIVVLLDAME